MKSVLGLLLCFALCACSKEREPDHRIQVSATQISLQGASGSTATFSITANDEWQLTTTGSGFTVSPTHGNKGTTTVTVSAVDENAGNQTLNLGTIDATYISTGSVQTISVRQYSENGSLTLLLYMPGISLRTFIERNIEGIRQAVNVSTPGNGRILVCYQPSSHASAKLIEIAYDATLGATTTELKTYTDFEASSVESIRQMFTDVSEYAPGGRYGLIIGCHGKAWVPSTGRITSLVLRPNEDDLWNTTAGAKQTRSFGDSGHELDITDLASALEQIPYKFDYLIFDDCFMASAETVYDLRHAVNYIVGSPCEIMAAGMPYQQITAPLFNSDSTIEALNAVCQEFYNFYENDYASINSEQSGCISVTVTAELDALAARMKQVNSSLQSFDLSALQYYEGLTNHLFYDLGQYVSLACSDEATRQDFKAQLDKTVVSRYHTNSFYSAYNVKYLDGKYLLHPVNYYSGLTTSDPSKNSSAISYLKNTNWYQATH